MCPFFKSLFSHTATSADLAAMLGSSLRLGRLRSIFGRLPTALGYAGGNTSLADAIDDASRLLVPAPLCANTAAVVASF